MNKIIYPRAIVKVNGIPIKFQSWEVENNAASTADTFSVTLPLKNLDVESSINNAYLLYTTDDIYVEIHLGVYEDPEKVKSLSEKSMKLMINGFVDRIRWNFRQDSITLTGRDKTSFFLDNEVSEAYTGQTVEQVIRKMAAQYGLSVESHIVGASTRVGVLSNGEQVHLVENVTEWDLMSTLVRQEGRDLFVRGNTLVYREPLTETQRSPIPLRWESNMEDLDVERVMKSTKKISVTVRSWSQQQKRRNTFTAVVDPDRNRAKQPSINKLYKKPVKKPRKKTTDPFADDPTKGVDSAYVVDIPTLSPAQVEKVATKLAEDINRHELLVQLTLPISTDYNMDNMIYIDNIPIPTKQSFIPKSVVTTFDADRGGQTVFHCVNHALPIKGDVG